MPKGILLVKQYHIQSITTARNKQKRFATNKYYYKKDFRYRNAQLLSNHYRKMKSKKTCAKLQMKKTRHHSIP